MRKWFEETLRTLSVTTYHPVGWGLHRIQSKLRRPNIPLEVLSAEYLSPVLFVHGIFHNSTAFYRFEKKSRKRGFRNLETIELWTSLRRIDDMAKQLTTELKELVNRVEAQTGYPLKARLVAHSLGGMIVRVALLDPAFSELVDKVIFLATPHQGSPLCSLPLPPCMRDLSRQSALMARLRNEPLPGGIQYWNLRGGLDIVTRRAATFLPHVPNISFERVGHAGLLSEIAVIESVLEILESPLYDVATPDGEC